MKDKVYIDLKRKPVDGLVRNDKSIKLEVEGLMEGSIEENVKTQLENFCKEDGGIEFKDIISITTPYLKEKQIDSQLDSFKAIIHCNKMYTDVSWLYKPTFAN
jgi:hypothetical protein